MRHTAPTVARCVPLRARCAVPLLLLLLLVLCSAVVPSVYAWNSNVKDKVYGICAWSTFAPDCVAPDACHSTTASADAAAAAAGGEKNNDDNNGGGAGGGGGGGGGDDGTGPVGVKATQSSPVAFTQAEMTKATAVPELCLARTSPPVRVPDKLTDRVVTTFTPRSRTSQMWLMRDGGGVLATVCMDSAPMFLRTVACKKLSDEEEEEGVEEEEEGDAEDAVVSSRRVGETVGDETLLRQLLSGGATAKSSTDTASGDVGAEAETVWEVTSMLFYNGAMHTWPSTAANANGLREVEVHLHRAQRTPAVPGETVPVYQSRCMQVTRMRTPPDLILSVPVERTNKAVVVRDVVLSTIDKFASAATAVRNGDAFKVTYSQHMPFLVRGRRKFHSTFYAYAGSMAQPPCSRGVARIVLVDPVLVPADLLTAYDTISRSATNNNDNTRFALLPSTLLHTGRFSVAGNIDHVNTPKQTTTTTTSPPPPTTTTTTTSSNHNNDNVAASASHSTAPSRPSGNGKSSPSTTPTAVQRAVAVMVAVDMLLLFYLILLLLARYECVYVPTMLGGLDHPVQFYTRAYEELPALYNAGLRAAADPTAAATGGGAGGADGRHNGGGAESPNASNTPPAQAAAAAATTTTNAAQSSTPPLRTTS